MKFVRLDAGEFMMGSPANEQYRGNDETQHREQITKPFMLGVHEVTQAQWKAVMGANPSAFKGDDLPVELVSWNDAVEFCQKLSLREGKKYRLPTEAEWEYACRSGTTTPFHFGATISTDQANYDGRFVYGNGRKGIYRNKTTAAGSFQPNAWGLYDMHGNVWEWCEDKYEEGKAISVWRGGSWLNLPWNCRSAIRIRYSPNIRFSSLGFRVTLDLSY